MVLLHVIARQGEGEQNENWAEPWIHRGEKMLLMMLGLQWRQEARHSITFLWKEIYNVTNDCNASDPETRSSKSACRLFISTHPLVEVS